MHGAGADLDFYGARAVVCALLHDDGVQRLVAVGLGAGNVVIVFAGNGIKLAVRPVEHGVAVFHVGHDNAHGHSVIDLLKGYAFAAHFFDDAVDVLGACLHMRLNAQRCHFLLQPQAQVFGVVFALLAGFAQIAGDLVVGFWLKKAESQVFKLPLDLPDA